MLVFLWQVDLNNISIYMLLKDALEKVRPLFTLYTHDRHYSQL